MADEIEIISTVFARPLSYDLVDLATAKEELGISDEDTTQDNWLARVNSAVSAMCAQYCNRVFAVEGIQDVIRLHSGHRYDRKTVELSRFPLALFVLQPTTEDVSAGGTMLPILDVSSIAVGLSVSAPGVPDGTTVVEVDGNEVLLSEAITVAVLAHTVVGFGLTVQRQTGSELVSLYPSVDYTIEPSAAVLSPICEGWASWEGCSLIVRYSAGYVDMPPDLVDAALRWITMRFKAKGRDPMLRRQEQRGSQIDMVQEFWVGGPPMSGSVPQEIVGVLGNYKVVPAAVA